MRALVPWLVVLLLVVAGFLIWGEKVAGILGALGIFGGIGGAKAQHRVKREQQRRQDQFDAEVVAAKAKAAEQKQAARDAEAKAKAAAQKKHDDLLAELSAEEEQAILDSIDEEMPPDD